MRLLLFDIDGTLIRANGVGRVALTRALREWADRPVSTNGVAFSGRTDLDIVASVLANNDLPTTEEMVEEAIRAYIHTMRETLSPNDVEVLPGVHQLLAVLDDRPAVHMGLVTGNVERIAYEKIAAHDLDAYFPFGAFGSDHADRNELVPIARRRAQSHVGHSFDSTDDIVIVGDTVHDIACARAVGARSVAVCTGRYERHELAKQNPDILLNTLRDTQQVLTHLLPP